MLAEKPNMDYAGSNVNLVITSSYMMLSVMESGEVSQQLYVCVFGSIGKEMHSVFIICLLFQVIVNHEMPNVSFASGGDAVSTSTLLNTSLYNFL